tara:strand:- start:6140 stop:7177 length:1038 start_codon:yes stop_codon:yes gene_type:complete
VVDYNNLYKGFDVVDFMEFDFAGVEGKKVLISGGAGFIGSNLTKRLVDLKAEVSIFVLPDENLERVENIKDKIKIISGDSTKEEDVNGAIDGKDYLFHFAWQTDLKQSMTNPRADVENDLIGLINILECCRKNNPEIKIVFASTVTVVGLTNEMPANEEIRENPLSVYEIHKLAAEKYFYVYNKIHGLKTCVLRLSNVFGEGQRIDNPGRGVLNFMVGRALRGEELTVYGAGNFIRDYNYVQNYIDAFILAALSDKTNGEVYVLGSGEGKTFNEVVEKIKKIVESLTDKKVVITHVPFPGEENEINKRNFIADSDKFQAATGWEPKVGFGEGLGRTVKFYLNKNE